MRLKHKPALLWALLLWAFLFAGCSPDRPDPPPANLPTSSAPIVAPVPPAGLSFPEGGLSANEQRQIGDLWQSLPAKARKWPVEVHPRPLPGKPWVYGSARAWFSGGWVMLRRGAWGMKNVAHEFGHAAFQTLNPEQQMDWRAWSKANPGAMPTGYRGTKLPNYTPDVAGEQFAECFVVLVMKPRPSGYKAAPQAVARLRGYLQ